MANNLQAQYDALMAARDRQLRDNEVQRAQALKAVDRRILQNGINGGHQETTELMAQSGANANASAIRMQYDPEIASLYARLQASKQRGGYGGLAKNNTSSKWGPGYDRSQDHGAYASMPAYVYYPTVQKDNPLYPGSYKITVPGDGTAVIDSRYL